MASMDEKRRALAALQNRKPADSSQEQPKHGVLSARKGKSNQKILHYASPTKVKLPVERSSREDLYEFASKKNVLEQKAVTAKKEQITANLFLYKDNLKNLNEKIAELGLKPLTLDMLQFILGDEDSYAGNIDPTRLGYYRTIIENIAKQPLSKIQEVKEPLLTSKGKEPLTPKEIEASIRKKNPLLAQELYGGRQGNNAIKRPSKHTVSMDDKPSLKPKC